MLQQILILVWVLTIGLWPASVGARPPEALGTERFVSAAATRGLASVELGELALQRSENAEVRRIARRMIDASAPAHDELLNLAYLAGLTPPDAMDLEYRAIKSRLSGLSGLGFDRAYLQTARTLAERNIALYRDYARHGADPALKDWAERMLPAARRSQQLADATARAIASRSAR